MSSKKIYKMVNRKRFQLSLPNEMSDRFRKIAESRKMPLSRLFEQAVEDLIEKYEEKDVK